MNTTLRSLLDEIQNDLEVVGDHMEPPTTIQRQQSLQGECARLLAYSLPAEYLELLALHDGVDCNGIQLYASEVQTQTTVSGRIKYLKRGLVEANLIWREFEPNKDYVVFAESGSDLYQHNLQTNQFEVADRVGRTVFNTFATAEELFETVLNHMLDRYEADEAQGEA